MYCAVQAGKSWAGPHRNFLYPLHWTSELEELWNDYLSIHMFTDDFWEVFWKPIHCGSLLYDIPCWRVDIQSILPLYVMRQTGVLYKKGMLDRQTEETNAYSDGEEVADEVAP